MTVVPSIVIAPDTCGVRPTAVVEPIPLNSSCTRNPTNVPVESSKLNSPIDVSTVHVAGDAGGGGDGVGGCVGCFGGDRIGRRHGGDRLLDGVGRRGVVLERGGGHIELDRGRGVVTEEPPDAEPGEHGEDGDATGDPPHQPPPGRGTTWWFEGDVHGGGS